jgi:uncharacterized protein with beta-barrel porin domain
LRSRILVLAVLYVCLLAGCRVALAAVDPYSAGIADAAAVRNIRNDAAFQSLTVIDPSKTQTITVSDGAGGTKTIQAVNMITLTSYTAPYTNATNLQRYTVDASSKYWSNIWTTLEGDAKAYLQNKGIPITNNTNTTNVMLESLGMGDWSGYKVLSLWVEAKYVTRPSYNPDITSNEAPTWNQTTGSYDFTNVNATTLPYFLGIAPVSKTLGWYSRPYDAFVGSDEYQNWLNAWSASSYDIGAGREFPYTGLGWTWNWNTDPNLTGFALSEFIVNGNAEFYFKGLRPTLGYLFPVIAQNANQASVANALDGIYDSATGDMRTALDSMVALDDGGAIANTFEETSPARLNLLTRQIVGAIDVVADRVNDRFGLLDSGILDESSGGSVWTSSSISWSKSNSSTCGFGSNGTSDTFVLGWEKRSERSLSGLALSYNSNNLTWNCSTGSADAGVTFLTGYHGCKLGKWRLGAEMGVGLIDINTHRQIPTLNQNLTGENSATGFVAGISASQPLEKNNWKLTPSIGLLYTRLEQDSYTETGSPLAMSINSQTVDLLRSDIGVDFENRFIGADNHTATQSLKLHWLCPLTDRNASTSGAFSGVPTALVNGVDRGVPGNTIQASYSISGEYGACRTLSLGYDYAKELDGGLTSHSVNIDYAVEF